MCGRDCKPALHHPRMARIPFPANRNLSVFCANTKKTGCAGCPFHAPDVLCSPKVRKKLINRAPLTRSCIQGFTILSSVHTYKPKGSQIAREPNACMCRQDCELVLRHLQMIHIPFTTNQNEHKGNWKHREALSVLCSPQVCGKLIYHAPNANYSQTIWFACTNL